jgi:hypothetical protein
MIPKNRLMSGMAGANQNLLVVDLLRGMLHFSVRIDYPTSLLGWIWAAGLGAGRVGGDY